MPITITGVVARDIRFPTSRALDGSDAMNPDPDYSAAYVVLADRRSGRPRGPRPDVHHRARQRAVRARRSRRSRRWSSGRTLEAFTADMGAFWRHDHRRQPAALGRARRRASIHLATAAVVNAVWDLWAKAEGKPLWKLLADMTPEELVALRRLPLHHRRADAGRGARRSCAATRRRKAAREAEMRARRLSRPTPPRPAGSATPTTSCARCAARRSPRAGRTSRSRSGATSRTTSAALRIIREEIGPDRKLMIDANQVWDVDEAIDWMRAAGRVRPVVDRGADQPRRRARPRGDRPRGRADRRRHRRALPEPGHLQAAAAGRARSASARSTPAGSAASTRCSRCCCWRRSSACRSARTPAASACASTCSTCRCSTTSRVSGVARGPHDRVRRPPARALRRPGA